MEKINKSRDKLMNEITLSFENQRLELIEKEKNIKMELDLKVTEIKEELEKYLIELNDILLSCERTNKIIQYYEKKQIDINSKNKTIYYIQEINQINKKVKKFLEKPIKSVEISFNQENKLNYKDYYINGNPPKNPFFNPFKVNQENLFENDDYIKIHNKFIGELMNKK